MQVAPISTRFPEISAWVSKSNFTPDVNRGGINSAIMSATRAVVVHVASLDFAKKLTYQTKRFCPIRAVRAQHLTRPSFTNRIES
jgi:hypothetical protein